MELQICFMCIIVAPFPLCLFFVFRQIAIVTKNAYCTLMLLSYFMYALYICTFQEILIKIAKLEMQEKSSISCPDIVPVKEHY